MSQSMTIVVEAPDDLPRFRLPAALQKRLHALLDKQDQGSALTSEETLEAEGLTDMADLLSLLRMRALNSSNGSDEDGSR